MMTPISIPNHPAPMYVSAPTYAIPAKLVRDTIYMPSSVAAKILRPFDGLATRDEEKIVRQKA